MQIPVSFGSDESGPVLLSMRHDDDQSPDILNTFGFADPNDSEVIAETAGRMIACGVFRDTED